MTAIPIDRLKAELRKVIVGLDHELAPNFALGAAYTWRQGNDLYEWIPRLGFTSADYTPNAPVTVGTSAR